MNASETTAKWVGWHRRDGRSPWRAIVTAETETAAFNKLLDMIRGGDKCILPAGFDPNSTPPQTRRRRF